MCSSSLPSSWSPIALHTTLSSHITQKGRITQNVPWHFVQNLLKCFVTLLSRLIEKAELLPFAFNKKVSCSKSVSFFFLWQYSRVQKKPILLNLKKQFPSAVTSTIFSPRESSCALNCAMSPFFPSFFSCEGTETEKMKSDTPVPGEDPSAEVASMEHSSLPHRASAACEVWSLPPLSSSSEPSCCLLVGFPHELHGQRPTARWEHGYGTPPETGETGRDRTGGGALGRERSGWA